MNPILRDFPTYFETERLIIRAPEPEDAAVVNQAVIESINELRPWMAWAKENPTIEQTAENIRRAHAKFLLREDLMYLLTLKESSSQTGKPLVGCSGLHSINWEIPSFEIGYWARSTFAGKGYITEAVRGLTDFAFSQLGANRVFIKCDVKNVRSLAVAERAGFEKEGLHRHDARDHFGNLRDTLCFATTKSQHGQATKNS